MIACVAVGVVCAVVAAPVVAAVAVGAVVGAVGLGAAAAVSTSITDGKVDWEAVGDCAIVGGVAGGIIAGTSYGVTKAVQAVAAKGASGTKLSGSWQKVNESMSEASRTYQTQITGHTGEAFVQNGVKFDGVIDGNLVDAKCHYAQFVDKSTGNFYNWFNGKQALLDEASRQVAASEGAHIQWYFAEQESLNAVKALFSQDKALQVIELIFKAMI